VELLFINKGVKYIYIYIYFSLLHFVSLVFSLQFVPRIMVLTRERKTSSSSQPILRKSGEKEGKRKER
jgi:hypothetical protein